MEVEELRKRKSEEISLAPKRPPKAPNLSDYEKDKVFEKPLFSKPEPKKEVKNEEDSFNLSDLSPTKEDKKCFICNKPLSHLNQERRRLHINSCLDIQETIRKQDTATEKHQNTIDCPICQTPFAQGPHRIAHIKSCGKKHAISGSKLLDMVEIQEKVTTVRKNNKVNHTKAPLPKVKPVTAPKLSGQPKSVHDEQIMLARAMSKSVRPVTPPAVNSIETFKEGTPEFTHIPDPADKRKKRPKSFAVVEFAPRTCQCQVVSAVQTRFVNAFKSAVRASKEDDFAAPRIDSQAKYQLRLVEKTNRYERLADDFSVLFNNGTGADLHITCGDGVIPAHKIILLARTRGFVKNEATIRMAEPKEIVTSWLRFIYTARVEWSPGQEDAIQALAQKYGPDSLLYVSRKQEKKIDEQSTEKSIPTISEELNECILGPSTSTVSQLTLPNTSVFVQTLSSKEVLEDTICGILDGTNPNDGEDPMQGINLSAATNEAITEEKEKIDESDDCMVLDETLENEKNISNITKHNEPIVQVTIVTSISEEDAIVNSPDIFDSISSAESLKDAVEPWHMTPLCILTPKTVCEEKEETENDKSDNNTALDSIEEEQNECFDYPIDEANDYEHWTSIPNYEAIQSTEQPSTSRALQTSPTTSFLQTLTSSQKFETPKCSKKRPSRLSSTQAAEVDSFDGSVDLIPRSPFLPTSSRNFDIPPLAHSTPIHPNKKLKFGSNVKIIKTTGITPMPNYSAMDDARLKIELGTHGLRPMGRKRAVAKLIEIYESVHPQIDPSTPTIRPLDPALPGVKEVDEDEEESLQKGPTRKPIFHKPNVPVNRQQLASKKKSLPPVSSSESSHGSDNDDLGDKTLNSDRGEPAEETILDDPTSLPKNIDEMKTVFLKWLRKKENEVLYNHILRLQPVLLEELHLKTSKQDDPVCSIPKKTLASILEMLGVTFSLPVATRGPRVAIRPGGRGGGAGRRRK